jgi:hypothetical protein
LSLPWKWCDCLTANLTNRAATLLLTRVRQIRYIETRFYNDFVEHAEKEKKYLFPVRDRLQRGAGSVQRRR